MIVLKITKESIVRNMSAIPSFFNQKFGRGECYNFPIEPETINFGSEVINWRR